MTRIFLFLFIPLVFLTGCLSSTPFQSARVAETNTEAATLALQRSVPEQVNSYSDSNNWTMADITGRFPLVKGKAEVSFNGAAVIYDSGDFGTLVGMGVKGEVIPEVLSFELPIRFWVSGEAFLQSAHIYPRAILSLPLHDRIELNLSTTRFFYLEGNNENNPAGYAIGFALKRKSGLVIRPEFGVLNYSNGRQIYQFGIGFSPGIGSSRNEVPRDNNPF